MEGSVAVHRLPARVADDPRAAKDAAALDIIALAAGLLENKDHASSLLAAQFCAMTDDAQAQFFVHVARVMGSWGSAAMDGQLSYIGRHLRTCECSTEAAREWVRGLAAFMEGV